MRHVASLHKKVKGSASSLRCTTGRSHIVKVRPLHPLSSPKSHFQSTRVLNFNDLHQVVRIKASSKRPSCPRVSKITRSQKILFVLCSIFPFFFIEVLFFACFKYIFYLKFTRFSLNYAHLMKFSFTFLNCSNCFVFCA